MAKKEENEVNYVPIRPDDFTMSTAAILGIIALSIALHFAVPMYLLDFSNSYTALTEHWLVGGRVGEYLNFHPKSIDYYIASFGLNVAFTFVMYVYMRRNYTPRYPSTPEQRKQAKVPLLQMGFASLVCVYVFWFMPVSNNTGLHKFGWAVFPPALPVFSSFCVVIFASTFISCVPLTKSE